MQGQMQCETCSFYKSFQQHLKDREAMRELLSSLPKDKKVYYLDKYYGLAAREIVGAEWDRFMKKAGVGNAI